MGELKLFYVGVGGTTDVTYALAGINDKGEVVDAEKSNKALRAINKALDKKEEKSELRGDQKGE